MKKLQLKYSTPKIKLNSVKKLCENKDNSSNIKNCATCSTMSITNKILTNAEQSEENSIQLTDSALFAKTFADFKNAHIPICAFSVYDSDFTHCYGSRINDRAVLLRCFLYRQLPLLRRLTVFFQIRCYVQGLFAEFTFRQTVT